VNKGMNEGKGYLIAKRFFDLSAAAVGLVLLSPLFLLVIVVIKLASSGPVFYTGTRVGKHGRLFEQLKFRTMVPNADKVGSAVTGRDDPRVTPIGRLLRRSKVDELPQLLNVIKGEMSFVGPRPEAPKWVELYGEEQRQVLEVTPGITDPVQILFRHEEDHLPDEDSYPQLMSIKVNKQLEYIQMRGFWSDVRVIFQTLLVLFQREPSNEAMQVYESLGGASVNIPSDL
jgi:lipopolysaccharide/colanic/teichoic acid biosynthesis glycosyltransferase